jgi:hypothetical protein
MYLWKSGDRYTMWTKRYEKTLEDGTVETYMVDKIRVRYPDRQQCRIMELDTRIISLSTVLYSRKTMKPIVPNKVYYCFAQSFHGGPDAKHDPLGGFCTGQFMNCYGETYKRNVKKLKKDGFSLVK